MIVEERTKHGSLICKREECAMHCHPHRYRNCCVGLAEVPEGECPFYKSKAQAATERIAKKERMRTDPVFRKKAEYYGWKANERGRQ